MEQVVGIDRGGTKIQAIVSDGGGISGQTRGATLLAEAGVHVGEVAAIGTGARPRRRDGTPFSSRIEVARRPPLLGNANPPEVMPSGLADLTGAALVAAG